LSMLLESGIELMMIGMGTVFSFLALLVVVTQAMSWVVLKFAVADGPVSTDSLSRSVGASTSAPSQKTNSAQHVAAIALALDTHLGAKKL
jgi:sodium pump decarboxylase gamma subunit